MTTRAGNNMPQFDVSSETFGVYIQKVNNLEQTMAQFAHTVDRGFDNIRSENKAANDVLSQSIGALSAKFDAKSQPQYNLMLSVGVFVLTIVGMIGSIVYVPVRNDVNNLASKLDTEISRAASHQEVGDAVTQLKTIIDQRLDESGARRDDWQRQSEKRDDAMTSDINTRMPRTEEELRWQWVDKQIDAMRVSKPKG